ncbi:MAG: hypothetical protein ACUVTD_07865 [Nitrososphaerales archaeon]
MAEFKRFSYGRTWRYSSYAKLRRELEAIHNQNEEILNKLKDIEDFLYKKFADTVASKVFEDKA